MDRPNIHSPSYVLPQITSEVQWDEISPIFIELNTSKKAPPGDYTIDLVFTYSEKKDIKQVCSKVPFI